MHDIDLNDPETRKANSVCIADIQNFLIQTNAKISHLPPHTMGYLITHAMGQGIASMVGSALVCAEHLNPDEAGKAFAKNMLQAIFSDIETAALAIFDNKARIQSDIAQVEKDVLAPQEH